MASAGPNYPSTAVNDTSVGTISNASVTNIYADDGSVTITAMSGGSGTLSNYIKATNFGFSIPSGATIDGIVVEIKRRRTSIGGNTTDNSVRIVKGGTISGNDYAISTTYSTAYTYYTYGSSSDLWGLSWTDSDINASTFGIAFSVKKTTGKVNQVNADAARITVYYTTGGGGGSSANSVLIAGD